MKAVLHTRVAPDDLLVARHFKQLNLGTLTVVTGNHRVAIGQPLRTAGVVKKGLAEVLIRHTPYDVAVAIDLNDSITIRAGDERVTIVEANCRKRPVVLLAAAVVCRKAANDFAASGPVGIGMSSRLL